MLEVKTTFMQTPELSEIAYRTPTKILICLTERMELVMPRMKPLEEWICDKCGKVTDIKQGWVEWLSPQDKGVHSFKIVHNRDACYHHTNAADRADNHLEYLTGIKGLQYLLSMLDVGVVLDSKCNSTHAPELRSFTDTVRRLHIPYYEEARPFFSKAKHDSSFNDENEYSVFLPDTCRAIIERYQDLDDA